MSEERLEKIEGRLENLENEVKSFKEETTSKLDVINDTLNNIFNIVKENKATLEEHKKIADVQAKIYQGLGAEYLQASGELREVL